MAIYRAFLYVRNEAIYFAVVSTYRARGLKELFGSYLHDTFTDKTLAKNLTPNYEVGMYLCDFCTSRSGANSKGCKRILLSQDLDYYKCFENKTATLIVDKIDKITETRYVSRSFFLFSFVVLLPPLVKKLKLML